MVIPTCLKNNMRSGKKYCKIRNYELKAIFAPYLKTHNSGLSGLDVG